MKDVDNKFYFESLNSTGHMVSNDYIYLADIPPRYFNDINFEEYCEIDINGQYVIKRTVYHELLLQYNETFRKLVAEEVLDDIDRYGYYATDEIEEAMLEVSSILNSDLLEHIDEELHDAICVIDSASYNKFHDKQRKGRRENMKLKKNRMKINLDDNKSLE